MNGGTVKILWVTRVLTGPKKNESIKPYQNKYQKVHSFQFELLDFAPCHASILPDVLAWHLDSALSAKGDQYASCTPQIPAARKMKHM